jgi:hypothetical protein
VYFSLQFDLYKKYLFWVLHSLCNQAAELAYTTFYSFSIPKGALHVDQQTALSDFCLPLAPGLDE